MGNPEITCAPADPDTRKDYVGLYRRSKEAVTNLRWQTTLRLGLNNLRVNKLVRRADIPAERLDLTAESYRQLVSIPILAKFAELEYVHSKPLEYLVSLALLDLPAKGILLDAAGGGAAEFSRVAAAHYGADVTILCQDAVRGSTVDGLRYIGGSIDTIPLEDSSIDGITCHHSFEHFQGDLDCRFIGEALRVLRPGGRLIISPLFITDRYVEIWNRRPLGRFDELASTIVDYTASFAGWGPFEGFARTYSQDAFVARIAAAIPPESTVRVFEIAIGHQPVPEAAFNRHQPLLNEAMRALLVVK